MKNNSFFQTSQGLRVCYIQKDKFHKSYAGIGLNYGGRDVNFYLDGIREKSQKGVAHFIEHKLYQMPDGDAFSHFSKMNANANAYTDLEKTIYYFSTIHSLYEPLQLLLEMYFTPYFTDVDVEKEKGIIQSEIQLYDDDPQMKYMQKILETLYPRSTLAAPVVGNKRSVSRTTVADLKKAYQAFYTAENSFLVIIGHEPREKVLSFVEDVLSKLKINHGLPRYINSLGNITKNDFIYEAKVEQTTADLAIRFSVNQNEPLFCEYIIGILDSLLSPSAPFYKELYQKKAFIADIDYFVSTLRDTGYAIISCTSNNPQLFLDCVEEKLKNIQKKDLHTKIMDIYLKHLKTKSILSLDSIEELGEETLILGLEGRSYLEDLDIYLSIERKDFTPYLEYFHSAQYVKAICKKSTK